MAKKAQKNNQDKKKNKSQKISTIILILLVLAMASGILGMFARGRGINGIARELGLTSGGSTNAGNEGNVSLKDDSDHEATTVKENNIELEESGTKKTAAATTDVISEKEADQENAEADQENAESGNTSEIRIKEESVFYRGKEYGVADLPELQDLLREHKEQSDDPLLLIDDQAKKYAYDAVVEILNGLELDFVEESK